MASYWGRLDSFLQEDNVATRALGFIEEKIKVGKKIQCVSESISARFLRVLGFYFRLCSSDYPGCHLSTHWLRSSSTV